MPMKLYELAKELEIPANQLSDVIAKLGIESKGNFTQLSDDQVETIKKAMKKKPAGETAAAPAAGVEGARKVRRRISAKATNEVPKKLKKKKVEEEAEEVEASEVAAPVEEAEAMVEEAPSEEMPKKTPKKGKAKAEEETKEEEIAPPVAEEAPVEQVKQDEEATAAPEEKTTPTQEPEESEEKKAKRLKKKKEEEEAAELPPKKKIIVVKKAQQPPPGKIRDFEGGGDDKFYPKKKVKWTKADNRGRKGKAKVKTGPKHTFNARKKDLIVGENISVVELASLIGVKAPEIIKSLMGMGIMATINQVIDGETAALVAADHETELKVEIKSIEDNLKVEEDKDEDMISRPPVVTIMGHVDHGKTSLLDKIRKTSVTAGEAGGITQHIGAYSVSTPEGQITFLDTPGHEAFTAMRARGANVTDIVILVVAADDGPRPQTVEAIHHAQAAQVPIVVAINKCDKPDAQPEKVKQQLMEHGIIAEDFGGENPVINVSAHSGEGIPKLLEMVHLQAEIMELRANPDRLAEGVVVESRVEKGKGNLATVLIQRGTLNVGDNYVVGCEYGRVRAMWDDKGKQLKKALPSMPVEIVGLNGLPKSGDQFTVGPDEKTVRQIAETRADKDKQDKLEKQKQVSLENLFANAGKEEQKQLNLIIKTDVVGSMEALSESLLKLGNEEVAVNVIHSAVGGIARSDVVLAAASQAIVIGFNTRPDNTAKKLAQDENIEIRIYSVIYEAIEDVTKALEGMLTPIVREELMGRAEVLEIFNIPKVGIVTGSKVIDGKFVRDCPVRVIRDNIMIHDGQLSSLQRFKDSVKEVAAGYECGIGIKSYKDLKVGDILESYTKVETQATL